MTWVHLLGTRCRFKFARTAQRGAFVCLAVGLTVAGFYISHRSVLALALAWIAHISFDRSIGPAYPKQART